MAGCEQNDVDNSVCSSTSRSGLLACWWEGALGWYDGARVVPISRTELFEQNQEEE